MGLKLDGCATVETIDSSGELLLVANHDISDLVEGRGVLNWEHQNSADSIIGSIIYARKILKKEDCSNDRQRYYWNIVQKPFVYIIAELFDDDDIGHPGAVAVAAMIRYYAKQGERLLTNFSIEGATLERNDYILQESVGRRVACTLRACNKAAIAGLLEDPKAKDIKKYISDMSDRVDHLIEVDSCIIDDILLPSDPILDLHKAMEDLNKTLTAGNYNVAPSQLTGGSALQVEHISGFNKNRVKAAIRDWDRKRPLRETIKAALPEVSDSYIDHFTKLAEDMALKKSVPSKLVRIGANHSPNMNQNDEQKKLLEGLYFDPKKKFGGKDFLPGHEDYSNAITKHKNDVGQNVLIKQPTDNSAENSTHYYELARDVFGMGKHVPVTNYFKLPPGSQKIDSFSSHHQAMEIIDKARTPLVMDDKELRKMHQKAYDNGSLHKLMVMDHVLGGAYDRHGGNYIVHPKGHLLNIDNDRAFEYNEPSILPAYMIHHGDESLHPSAVQWIKDLNSKDLVGKMADQGRSPEEMKHAAMILKLYQKQSHKPMTARQMWDNVNAHATAIRMQDDKKARGVA